MVRLATNYPMAGHSKPEIIQDTKSIHHRNFDEKLKLIIQVMCNCKFLHRSIFISMMPVKIGCQFMLLFITDFIKKDGHVIVAVLI